MSVQSKINLEAIRDMKISFKVPMFIVSLAVLTAMVTGIVSYFSARTAIIEGAESKLIALSEARSTALSDWMGGIEGDLSTQAQSPLILQSIHEFTDAWQELPGNQTAYLQHLYIDANPNPTGEKENLDSAPDGSTYSAVHAEYHPYLRAFLRDRGYYDIFLFDTNGNLIYSVYKELDYATNLNAGEWSQTDLGNAFRAARDNPRTGFQQFFDFQPYAPSNDAPAAFVSTPVLEEDGSLAGVLVFQMPIERLNNLMQQTAGLGESGETYLVGEDLLMRSDSRFSEESTILARTVDTPAARAALSGETGFVFGPDYRGVRVGSAYQSVDIGGVSWAVLAEIDSSEMLAPVASMRNSVILLISVSAIVLAALGIFIGRSISRPLTQISDVTKTLAEGNNEVEVPFVEGKDEVGDIARNVLVFKENAIERGRLEAEQRETDEAQRLRVGKIDDLIKGFDEIVSQQLSKSGTALTGMLETADSLGVFANDASVQSTTMASAAEEASVNVQTVAAASEELSASISEISSQMTKFQQISNTANEESEKANLAMTDLKEMAGRINRVIDLITDIADQTNLLALNATIEAARAGDAGRGFAVVASEVKTLANQTAKATEEIAGEIQHLQEATEGASQNIQSVVSIIEQSGEIALSVGSAVEEQSATTSEISKNVQEAAQGTSEVSQGIGQVSKAAGGTKDAAGDVSNTASNLSSENEKLRQEVEDFLKSIRAA